MPPLSQQQAIEFLSDPAAPVDQIKGIEGSVEHNEQVVSAGAFYLKNIKRITLFYFYSRKLDNVFVF